jgi:hypothetical protein
MKKVLVLCLTVVLLLSVSIFAVYAEEELEVASVESDADYPGGGYPVEQIIDGINGTYWIGDENVSKSELTFTFANIVNIDRIKTYNMYSMNMVVFALVDDEWVEVGSTELGEYVLDEPTNTYGHDIIFDSTATTYKIKMEIDKADSSWNQPQGGEVRFFGTPTSEAAPADEEPVSPATSDGSMLLWIAALMLSGAAVVIVLKKRVTE